MNAGVAGPAVRRPPVAPLAAGTAWWRVAVAGTAAAGLLHLVTALEHAPLGGLVVAFFLAAAVAQLAAAAWLTATRRSSRSPRLVAVAVAGTAALLLLYLVAHTSTLLTDLGLVPTGHDGGGAAGAGGHGADHSAAPAGPVAMGGEAPAGPEPATPLGTATVAAEVLGLAGLVALLPGRWRAGAVNALASGGAAVWLLWFTGVLS